MAKQVATGPDPVEVGDGDHVLTTLWHRAGTEDGARAMLCRPEDGAWMPMTSDGLVERVRSVAAGLVAGGVSPGDRVAIMSPTRIEWTVADLAVLAAGAVVVPIYDTSSEDQARHILSDSAPVLAIVADDDTAELAGKAAPEGGSLQIVTMDGGGLDDLAEAGDDSHRDEVERRVSGLSGADVASIVYTSGTTGAPKGCVLTHRNLVWTARQTLHRLDGVVSRDDSTLLFLPLAHIFTRVVSYVCIEMGVQIGFARSLDDMPEDLRSFQPTFLLAVPRVFEKVFRSAQRQATGPKAKIFDLAVGIGTAWSRAERPGPHLRLGRVVADRLVYAKLRAGVGGAVRFCVSGGAPLDPHLGHFFRAAGIPILEGYGLTETSAPAAVNIPSEMKIGTVGRPLPGVSIRIGSDGEIQIAGENVLVGYHQNEETTEESFDGEWFLTGDLGEIDDDGYLSITDRKKELIVTASGKNVAPSPLEQRIAAHRLVANAMLVGDRRPFLGALVSLDPDELGDRDPDSEEVRQKVQEAIDDANRTVSRAESIRKFVVLDRDFNLEEDELTQTMKLRRTTIAEHFADEIDSIYADSR